MTEVVPDVLVKSPVVFETVIGLHQRSAVLQGKRLDAVPNLHIRDRNWLGEHRWSDRKLRLNGDRNGCVARRQQNRGQ